MCIGYLFVCGVIVFLFWGIPARMEYLPRISIWLIQFISDCISILTCIRSWAMLPSLFGNETNSFMQRRIFFRASFCC